ncbi:MAG: PTS galactitol transporter subunit IIC [Anaerolineae bacterium]|jgi:galactitol PTS system EIIC component|nr:PTS galactitol transporter subunit IIC [Anaerolineae bacterium]
MDGILESLNTVFNTFGSAVFVPVMLFIIAMALGTGAKKAFFSALYAGVGLVGFGFVINAYIPLIVPAVQNMVTVTGIELDIVDIGWQATAVVAYATQAGMLFLGVGLLFQIVLFLVGWTNIFQPGDLWNNYSYMVWGSLVFVATGNMWLALACMLVLNLYSLLFSEILQKRWSTYYGYENCTVIQLHHVGAVPFAIGANWIFNKLGLSKIRWSPESIKERLGFIGEPVTLGLILGMVIGLLGNLDKLGTLAAWGNIMTIGISTAAVMAVFPRVAGLFAQAFTAITQAARERSVKSKSGREIYIGVNDATGYGEPATLISGIILIPIMVLVATIIPGNKVLPLVDLIALPFMVTALVAIMNGNIFKVVVSGTIWFSMGLVVATKYSGLFTKVASQFGVELPSPDALVTSFGILTKPIFGGLIFPAFLNESWLWIIILLVIYFVAWAWLRKNKQQVHDYLERTADGDAPVEA